MSLLFILLLDLDMHLIYYPHFTDIYMFFLSQLNHKMFIICTFFKKKMKSCLFIIKSQIKFYFYILVYMKEILFIWFILHTYWSDMVCLVRVFSRFIEFSLLQVKKTIANFILVCGEKSIEWVTIRTRVIFTVNAFSILFRAVLIRFLSVYYTKIEFLRKLR